MRRAIAAVLVAVFAATTVAGCGSSETADEPGAGAHENNPPGDIPDDIAFVAFHPAGGKYEISVPEGWARTTSGDVYTFTDKLNTVRVEVVPAAGAPTVASATATEVPVVRAAAKGFALQKVQAVQRKGGTAVLVTYRADSPVDPVTGKVVPDAFERYEFFHAGTEAILTLSGPVNADNVDPWRTVSDSFRWLG
jgi:hypothetical protein